MARIQLKNIAKAWGAAVGVKRMSLDIADGEFLVLLGPSGCGKTTTMRMVAGLEDPSEGEIWIGDRCVNTLEPKDRDVAMVFQSYGLYPNMTVYENISFPLRIRGTPKADIHPAVMKASAKVELDDFLQRRPKELSGGQRQRVALARAIVREPKVFLMDEPLSNLDAKLRVSMRAHIKHLHHELAVTTVYVTHDQVEAMTLADRVVVMNHGVIEQVDTPQQLYHNPRTKFVAGFIGSPAMNMIPVSLLDSGSGLKLDLGDGVQLQVPAERTAQYRPHAGKARLLLGLRPEHLTDTASLSQAGGVAEGQTFSPIIDVSEPMGMETLVYFQLQGITVCGKASPDVEAPSGKPMQLTAKLQNMHLIDDESGLVL
ncbi:MAG TPA: sn-glycerol-3-phosphate ABC transporter ATP-binding protein UgpC [Burkholderiaceae bacterium]|nr:sn-glycerol-3-phosphate ABC transporter ATP-binding protein UgpC [Burkholderiaceae bacterium]